MSDTYKAEYTCRNCGYAVTITIPKGQEMYPLMRKEERSKTRLSEFSYEAPECPRCGCYKYSQGKFKEG